MSTSNNNLENRLLFIAGLIGSKETLPKRVAEMLTDSEPEPFWHNMHGEMDRRHSFLIGKIDTGSAVNHRQTVTTILGENAVQTLGGHENQGQQVGSDAHRRGHRKAPAGRRNHSAGLVTVMTPTTLTSKPATAGR